MHAPRREASSRIAPPIVSTHFAAQPAWDVPTHISIWSGWHPYHGAASSPNWRCCHGIGKQILGLVGRFRTSAHTAYL